MAYANLVTPMLSGIALVRKWPTIKNESNTTKKEGNSTFVLSLLYTYLFV